MGDADEAHVTAPVSVCLHLASWVPTASMTEWRRARRWLLDPGDAVVAALLDDVGGAELAGSAWRSARGG